MRHASPSHFLARTSTHALAIGLFLVLVFFVERTHHGIPTSLATVRGKIADIASIKGGLSILLVPEGGFYNAGHYYRYSSTSGAAEVMRLQLLEDPSKLVTLRYSSKCPSNSCNEVYEVSINGYFVRTVGQVLDAQRENDTFLLAAGTVLIFSAVVARWVRRRDAAS